MKPQIHYRKLLKGQVLNSSCAEKAFSYRIPFFIVYTFAEQNLHASINV